MSVIQSSVSQPPGPVLVTGPKKFAAGPKPYQRIVCGLVTSEGEGWFNFSIFEENLITI